MVASLVASQQYWIETHTFMISIGEEKAIMDKEVPSPKDDDTPSTALPKLEEDEKEENKKKAEKSPEGEPALSCFHAAGEKVFDAVDGTICCGSA